jgi:hypothetical protein
MRFVSYTMLFFLFVVLCLGLINLAIKLAPEERRIDCSLAEFHPDYTNEMRQACREARRIKV